MEFLPCPAMVLQNFPPNSQPNGSAPLLGALTTAGRTAFSFMVLGKAVLCLLKTLCLCQAKELLPKSCFICALIFYFVLSIELYLCVSGAPTFIEFFIQHQTETTRESLHKCAISFSEISSEQIRPVFSFNIEETGWSCINFMLKDY